MTRIARRALLQTGAGAALAAATGWPARAQTLRPRPAKPIVLGHRGAPAHRPEHTLGSYAKAIADGADYVEPDLVITRDGALVARHENNIAETTDVAAHAEFAGRKATKIIDGTPQTGWFTEDFTLAELKTLRARERLGAFRPESQGYDGQFQVVTLEEIADFVTAESAARGRVVGLIPEIKHSTYFAGIGLPVEERFIATVRASHFLSHAPVIVQSFETANLRLLRRRLADLGNIQLMQLVDDGRSTPADLVKAGIARSFATMVTPPGLADIATYADYVSPNDRLLIPLAADGRLGAPTTLAADVHAAGLLLCTWTFRPENHFLPVDFRNAAGDGARNPEGSVAEIRRYLAVGVDAFFTDDPALGRRAVDGMA